MRGLWQDIRYALRIMLKTPALTTVLVVTLALGIGASTTIFSVVNSVILRPLPYEQPDRIMRVYTEFHNPTNPFHKFWLSVPEVMELKRECRACALVGAWVGGSAPIAGGDRPVRAQMAYANHDLLPLLGVKPLLGRWFDAEEDSPTQPMPSQMVGEANVVIINYNIWQRAFGGDPAIIGKHVTVDAIPATVIGVMPRGFDFLDGVEAWVPGRFWEANPRRASHSANVVVRLKEGETLASLQSELAALSKRLGARKSEKFHTIAEDHPLVATEFHADLVGSLAKTLWLLQAAVLFVLLISIVNVANLLLARAETRTREVAVRHALGASRRRLVRQFVTESLVLGIFGGALGILVSVWAIDGVTALIPKSAPRASEIRLDTMAVVFAVGCSVFAALLFGLAPILHARKSDLHGPLKEGARATGSRVRLRARRVLVIVEIALAVVLVIGCTVMVRSFVRLQRVELGFKPDRVLTFGVALPFKAYAPPAANAFWDRLEDRLQTMPGIDGSVMIDSMLPARTFNVESINFPGRSRLPIEDEWNVDYLQLGGPNTIHVLGGRIVAGRDIEARDTLDAPKVAIVNAAFARKFFPGQDPIGHEVTSLPSGDEKNDRPARIVGVFADIKNAGVDKPAGTELILPRKQYQDVIPGEPLAPFMQYAVIRAKGDPKELIPAAHRIVGELDPAAPLFEVRTMDQLLWEAVARPRFLTFLLTSFAFVALLLAAVGIYGVMAHMVALRTHEIGLRVALGAQPAQVRSLVLRQAAVLVAAGVGVGLLGAVVLQGALDTSLRGLLYGGQLSQPLLLGGVALAVAATALLATWIPARRATRVEPTVALRSE